MSTGMPSCSIKSTKLKYFTLSELQHLNVVYPYL
jgi:hypothetical protein